jgi:hypothetical protein
MPLKPNGEYRDPDRENDACCDPFGLIPWELVDEMLKLLPAPTFNSALARDPAGGPMLVWSKRSAPH